MVTRYLMLFDSGKQCGSNVFVGSAQSIHEIFFFFLIYSESDVCVRGHVIRWKALVLVQVDSEVRIASSPVLGGGMDPTAYKGATVWTVHLVITWAVRAHVRQDGLGRTARRGAPRAIMECSVPPSAGAVSMVQRFLLVIRWRGSAIVDLAIGVTSKIHFMFCLEICRNVQYLESNFYYCLYIYEVMTSALVAVVLDSLPLTSGRPWIFRLRVTDCFLIVSSKDIEHLSEHLTTLPLSRSG